MTPFKGGLSPIHDTNHYRFAHLFKKNPRLHPYGLKFSCKVLKPSTAAREVKCKT